LHRKQHDQEKKMRKLSMPVAFAALLASAMPAAYAQTRAAPETRTEATGAQTNTVIQQNQIRASKMIGGIVYDVQNRSIGSVKDLVLNKDGKVADVVIDVGAVLGMGGKYVAVAMNDIKTDNNRLTLDRTKDQLQQMPEYRLEDRNTGAGTSTSPTTGGRLGH
jgi:sporulation protein YlmC with PRC-barrel domain